MAGYRRRGTQAYEGELRERRLSLLLVWQAHSSVHVIAAVH